MCKQIYDAYGYNGICVTALDLHILLEARAALPSRDFCGHKLTALGNNQLGCFKRQGKGAFHVKFASGAKIFSCYSKRFCSLLPRGTYPQIG